MYSCQQPCPSFPVPSPAKPWRARAAGRTRYCGQHPVTCTGTEILLVEMLAPILGLVLTLTPVPSPVRGRASLGLSLVLSEVSSSFSRLLAQIGITLAGQVMAAHDTLATAMVDQVPCFCLSARDVRYYTEC